MKQHFLSLLTVLLLAQPGAAHAQANYYNADKQQPAAAGDSAANPASEAHSIIVTSIAKCYAQLPRAEALDIQRNYAKPYEECRGRVAALAKKQQLKAGEQKDDKTLPDVANQKESPVSDGGFYRVQKSPATKPPENKNTSHSNAAPNEAQ